MQYKICSGKLVRYETENKAVAVDWKTLSVVPVSEFTAILRWRDVYYLAGVTPAGYPCMFTSLLGMVWEKANLSMLYPIADTPEKGRVLQLLPDEKQSLLHLVCSSGQIITLSDCSKCTRILRVSDVEIREVLVMNRSIRLMQADGQERRISLDALESMRMSWSYAEQQFG